MSFHGLFSHARAGADPRVGSRVLRARGASSCARVGSHRGHRPRPGRQARRGRLSRRVGARHDLVRTGDGGARPRRLVCARNRLRQRRPCRQDDREVGDERAKGRVAAEARVGRSARLLRADRAWLGVRPVQPRYARRARRRRVGHRGGEDLHHARLVGGRRARVRAHGRGGCTRLDVLPRPDRFAGLRRDADQGQARAPRTGHGGAGARRRPRAGREPPRRRGRRLQGGDVGARQRPHLTRRRLRRHRPGLPRGVPSLRGRAEAVRQADRLASARAGADRRDRCRLRGGAPADVAGGRARRRGCAAHAGVLRREVPRERGVGAGRERGRAGAAGTATSTSIPSASTCATRG
jgi:hypothetical protein